MPLIITIGFTPDKTPVALYCGGDAVEGKRLMDHPPVGIVRTQYFKNPVRTLRRDHQGNLPQPEAAPVLDLLPDPPADEVPAEEPAPAEDSVAEEEPAAEEEPGLDLGSPGRKPRGKA